MATFTPQQYQQRVRQFLSAVKVQLPVIQTKLAIQSLSQIKDRIIENGKGADGGSFGKYSENQVPFFYYKNGTLLAPYSSGEISAGARSAVDSAKKRGKKTLSYKEWREANGLQTDHVDMKFSGDMWSDIGVLSDRTSGGVTTISVGAKNTKQKNGVTTDDKLEHLSNKYDDEILELSDKEERELAQDFDAELQRLIDQYLA